MPAATPRAGVYVLEFAGETDALPAREAASAAAGVEVVAPGVATARALDRGRVRDLAYVRRAGELLARADADVAAAVAALRTTPTDRTGTVAVRARDVRGTASVDTRRAERELGAVLVERGFAVDLDDPDHELLALFSAPAAGDAPRDEGVAADGACLLAWVVAESVRDFGERAPTDRPFFRPGSMEPMLARALVNVALADRAPQTSGDGRGADASRGPILLDPMCGTGGVLIEAGLVGAATVGVDAREEMVRGTRENLAATLDGGDRNVLRGDATRLPLRDGAVDAAVFDVPYGRQSSVAADSLGALVAGALAEARRVAPRAVVVGDRDWSDAAADAGWAVVDRIERRVHRSLVRHVHVLDVG